MHLDDASAISAGSLPAGSVSFGVAYPLWPLELLEALSGSGAGSDADADAAIVPIPFGPVALLRRPPPAGE